MALGADGNVWYADNYRKVVGRVSPSGQITQFSVDLELVGGAQTIAAGPDGNMYVNASSGGGGKPDFILRVTPAGEITRLSAGSVPASQGFGTGPESITAGPDGNLWFTEFWANRVGRLTPSGSLTEFTIPTAESSPRGIVTGPDGNLWFVEATRFRPAIARITPQGVITEFPITFETTDNTPNDIVSGPDGKLWFTEMEGMGRISTSGEISQVALPQGSRPAKLLAAPDGNVWYSDAGRYAIVRLGASGATRTYPLPRRLVVPWGMAVGADGRIWFGESEYGVVASIGLTVPEPLMSTRPLVFADAAPKTVSVRNVGNAPLVISSVRITGLDAQHFTKGSDTCSGASLKPDASCEVQLRYGGGGPSGLQSALVEITDNGTGSPQRLSLLAHVPQCTLPVMRAGSEGAPAQGGQFDVRSVRTINDPNGGFEGGGAASGVRTSAPATLLKGVTAGYYDRPFGRWLPVGSASEVSPDGSRYAYMPLEPFPRTEVHVVDVATGGEKVWKIHPDFWGIVAFTRQGIYLHVSYEGIGAGLWLLDPDTGAFKEVFTDGIATVIDGTAAWLMARNPADKLPDVSAMGGATNEISKRNLATGKTTVWLYRPGTNMVVVATAGGMPILFAYDGQSTTYWIMSAPNQAQKMEFPFSTDRYGYLGGFVADAYGVWVGSVEGVYLWTPRTGGVLMTDERVTPAGTCA
jgi:streptogramin lyase